ncbi:unnamed protein product [Laminaria digitata]
MQEQAWDRIDVVTYADGPESLNPVVAALQAKKAEGELMDNFHIHTNRTMGQDLQAMLCADGLALAQSTLKSLVGFHSSAVWVFGALGCNRMLKTLAAARPNTMVYGVSKLRRYSVFESWENTSKQRDEMLTYNRMRGLKRCRAHFW